MTQAITPPSLAGDRVHGKLRAVWRRQRLSAHLAGVAWVVLITLPMLLALFALDWLLTLPRYARWALLLGAIGVLVWQVQRRWLRKLRAFDALSWAGRVESKFPQLNTLLISYVQLVGPKPAATGSPELFEVVKAQASSATAKLNFGEAVDMGVLKPLYKKAAIVLLVFAIVAVVTRSHAVVAVKRYLGQNISYPTLTRFTAIPGDQLLARGDALELAVSVDGKVPRLGKVLVRPEGGAWREVDLERQEDGGFLYAISHVSESFEFYFTIGDARSHERGHYGRVEVVPPPKILSQQVTVTPPSYTGLAPVEQPTLAGSVLAGSSIDMGFTVDREMAAASLLYPDGTEQALKIAADGLSASVSMTPTIDGVYQLQLTPSALAVSFPGEPYRLRIAEDQPPTATLIEPTSALKATVNKRLPLVVRASDDYGLTEMAIVFRLNESPQRQRVPLGAPPRPEAQRDLPHTRSGTWPLQWQILADLPQLQPGDRLQVAIEVTEVGPDAASARTAVTDEVGIEVLSLADYQAYIVTQLDELRQRVGEAEKAETLIKHDLNTLLNKDPAPENSP